MRNRAVVSWAVWDFGSAAFNAVLITFIFSVYLVESVGTQIHSAFTPAQWLSFALALGGIAVALITPMMGQRSDLHGRRKRAVGVWTWITVALMAALFLVSNTGPQYFWLGLFLLSLASVTFECAEVNYFAQLSQISTPKTVGRVSGFGWAMGYVGGIVLLLLCYVFFISGDGGVLGIPTENGLNIRVVAVVAAAWFGLSSIPLLLFVPESTPASTHPGSIADSYRRLWSELKQLWHLDRNAVRFLIASAIFRDGLAGVFTYGAILGVSVYGLKPADVLIFGIAANITAAVGALLGGLVDDRFGPKSVIMASLLALIACAGLLFAVDGPVAFWILGLLLCVFVGPAQSSSRSLLARIAPAERSGQMFGFYTTTGRAVSWLAPLAFSAMVSLGGGSDRYGVIGIGIILAAGAVVLAFVADPTRAQSASQVDHTIRVQK
ncbi:MFS transporter [Corynebacterium tapiri]|uniref:MFS transporter n=1 Tax=Corynebacterium tapiri TaxID=1448266 RepID=A0A5C4U437_9CORY|nr:MFS transporter [Corynebacterium tapiri]TNL96085.1 MFS transporter [Corynebacterium tapiri]